MEKQCKSWLCTLTGGLFKEPVVAADGHTYERRPILQWFEKEWDKDAHNFPRSPMTNQHLDDDDVVPNHTLTACIEEAKDNARVELGKKKADANGSDGGAASKRPCP